MPPPARPNILLILTDQQRFDTLAAHVNSFGAATPGMDSLVRRGVSFENAFCTAPICAPARAAIFTGHYPGRVGMHANLGNPCPPLGYRHLTLGHRLQAAGYQTVYHGKSHLGGNLHEYGFEIAFENSHDASTATEAARFWRNRDWIINKRPFFHVVSLLDPHDIYFLDPEGEVQTTLPPWPNQDDPLEGKPWPQRHYRQRFGSWSEGRWAYYRDFYRQRLERVDRVIDELLQELICSGFGNNTWIIFTSDHGDMGGEHGLPFKGPFMYDGVLRVPLVITPPDARLLGSSPPVTATHTVPARSSVLCSHIDLMPTILDLAGIEADPTLPGRSLRPVVEGRPFEPPPAVFAEWHQAGRMITPIRTIRTLAWKYNVYLNIGEELYDLASDPHELHNRASDPACSDIRQALRQQIDTHLRMQEDPFYTLATTDADGRPLVGAENA